MVSLTCSSFCFVMVLWRVILWWRHEEERNSQSIVLVARRCRQGITISLLKKIKHNTDMAGGKLTPKEKLSTYLQLFFNGDSIILSLLLFIIFAAHFFVYYERTAHLRVFGRPYVWLHLWVALLALYPIMKYHTTILLHLLYGDLGCANRKKNEFHHSQRCGRLRIARRARNKFQLWWRP